MQSIRNPWGSSQSQSQSPQMDTYRGMRDYPRYPDGIHAKPFVNHALRRLPNFVGGYFADFNLSTFLEHERTDSTENIHLEVWSPGLNVPAEIKDAKKAFNAGKGRMALKGQKFGPTWSNHWFKITIRIPKGWEKYERVILNWESGGEAMIFDESGDALQGFTGSRPGDGGPLGYPLDTRQEWIIPTSDVKRGSLVRYLEFGVQPMGGVMGIDPPPPDMFYTITSADLVAPNLEAWALNNDFETLRGLADNLGAQSPLGNLARVTANEVMNTFRLGDASSIADCRKVAEKVLGQNWEEEVVKSRTKDGRDKDGQFWGLGHCHIDTAWLWPWAVTKKKVARSWTSQLDLMDRYPEHRFAASSAQQYAWLEEYYPKAFERLQERVKEGRFDLVGATWVEHDANLPSGESFVRQFLLGQNFFQSRFGKRCEVFSLPDTFGYSAALPQIARLAGAKYFFTQKISWNANNTFPLTTFNWMGLDGTQILTHMTSVVNYNSSCRYDDFLKGYNNHQNLDVSPDSMLLFGLGDGGGGPTYQMLERLRRARAVSVQNDPKGAELPMVRMGTSMEEFFGHIKDSTGNGEKLATWWGELYLEIHRGTYTSQAVTKLGNRTAENKLREAEQAATLASLVPGSKYEYPHEAIQKCWEGVCLCQFHDTLPGSEIAIARSDVEDKFAEVLKTADELLHQANAVLAGNASDNVIIENTLPQIARSEVVVLDENDAKSFEWEGVQVAKDGKSGFALATAKEGQMRAEIGAEDLERHVTVTEKDGRITMEAWGLLLVLWNGRIVKLQDNKLKRDLIPQGSSAGFVIYEDQPNDWDAWEVETFHLEKAEHLAFSKVELLESGPVRAVLGCELQFGNSRGIVYITLDAGPASPQEGARPLLRFDVDIDWQEKHRFLKFELPTTIVSTEATFETAFGWVKRPTHRNTSWDAAKFEVPAHKFADLSEYGYGITIVNNCKYGYAVEGGVMRLSLLRSPLRPDPDCDRGRQRFAFGVLPHLGSFVDSPAFDVAQAFNAPMQVRKATAVNGSSRAMSPLVKSFPFKVEGARNVFLETVKRGEADANSKGSKTVVLRMYEHFGGSAQATLKINGPKVKKASIVNLLEDELESVDLWARNGGDSDGEYMLELNFRAFEIKTVKLVL